MDLDELFQMFEENLEAVCRKAEVPEPVAELKENSQADREGKQVWLSTKQRKKAIMQKLSSLAGRSSMWQVFGDWVAIMALMLSNIFDPTHGTEREAEMVSIEERYTIEEAKLFLKLFADLSEIIVNYTETVGYVDILGEMYMELGLSNERNGQYFTPREIAYAMGIITIGAQKENLREDGFMTVAEPAAGSGAMVLGIAQAASEQGINPSCEMAVLAVDTDILCVHMCYVQMSLYAIPAVIQHGNTLTVEAWSKWYTPSYIAGDWVWRAKLGLTDGRDAEDEALKCATQPLYGLMVYGFQNGGKKAC